MERTGHCSFASFHRYQCPSELQHEMVSDALNNGKRPNEMVGGENLNRVRIWIRTCKISQISSCLEYWPNYPYFHQNAKFEFLTKFGLKSSTFTLPKATFLKCPLKYWKRAILPESGHAKFLKFLNVSNTNQTIFIFIRIPNLSSWPNLALTENGNKNFIGLFERHSKTIYRSLLQNLYICLIWWDIPPSWIFVDINDTSQLGSHNFFFLRHND